MFHSYSEAIASGVGMVLVFIAAGWVFEHVVVHLAVPFA
jgi:hypothetical protein